MVETFCLFFFSGLLEWKNVTISSQTQSLDIENLYKGALYEIRAAERKAQNSEPDTLFTIPIEVRTGKKEIVLDFN